MTNSNQLQPRPEADLPEEQQADLTLRSIAKARLIDPESDLILDEVQVIFPHVGTEIRLYKVLNTKSGDSRRIAVDAKYQAVDYDELYQKERALEYEKYGSMQVELHRIVELGEASTIPVLIKYAVPEEPVDKTRLEDERAQEEGEARARELEKYVQTRATEMFRETMRQWKLAVPDEVSQSGPFISTELPLDAIRELSRDPRVAFIGLDQEKVVLDYPTIEESLPTTRTEVVHNSGFKGAGIKIAVLESGGLSVSQSCFNISATQVSSAAADSHMTKSVGIIGNRYNAGKCDGAWQGYAPQASVLLANNNDYKTAYEWAKSKGVNVITMSWHYGSEETSGNLHSRDIYFDYAVTHYPWPTVFTSAGNGAPGDYASGKGYNFFGVGNVLNDGDGNRCNDVISSDSSWKNPTSPHSDREVPEIAAPGSRHELLGSSFGGTSCATPVTASIATVLMSKNTSLKIWPEAIRAILLATANYQNADNANWSKFSDGKDGTGMINTLYAYWTAGRRETSTSPQYRAHDYGSIVASDFSGGFFTKTWKAYTGTTKSRIRVALTWNSKTTSSDGSPTSSVLDADLDLWVYDPQMNLVAWSTTWDSNYEFIEFTPSKTGSYTIKIRGYSVPANFWSYYGIAWTTHYDLCQ